MSHPDYAQLDECIKVYFTEAEYAALGDEERRCLIEDLTNPEVEEE